MDRLNSISSPAFNALYDGDSLRTYKNGGTPTYFLNDEDGTPVIEEQFSGTTPYISAFNVFGADGLRERYEVDNLFYGYSYYPQGSTQTRTTNLTTQTTTFNDEELYDACGGYLVDQSPNNFSHNYAPDPIGFGGQWGYYTDTETHLQSLTHRYYDAGAGSFINRDLIGYNGGINLYGFAGNNPI